MTAPVLLIPLLGLRPAATSSVVYVRNVVLPLSEEWGPERVVVLGDAFARRQLEGFRGIFEQHDVADRRVARLLALRRHVPRAEARHRPGVVFVPEGQIVGAPVKAPVVIVLHHHLNFSQPQGQPWGRRLYWILWHDRDIRRNAARASALVAPTTVFAEELLRHVPEALGKIRVVHHGVGAAFRAPLPHEARATGAAPHVLAVANPHRYKNLAGALRIFARACDGLPHELHVAGVTEDELRGIAASSGAGEAVARRARALGVLREARLAAQYRQASALLFPSLVESFGLPVVEAMASGCPVACSDLPALREVSAGAAATAPASDEAAFAAALRGILTDAVHADALRAAGLERAKAFSWRDNARKLAEVLRAAAASRDPPRRA